MVKSYLILVVLFISQMLVGQIEGDNIFENDQVIKIELNFPQESFWDSLTLNYETTTYMSADLILTDSTGTYEFENVGVRLKGNSSYNHPGNKKSFKIDFNEYVSGQNYDGLKKLNFSNGFKDPSLMREKVFFDVCRAANVPAPRANFANVYFNGTLWGFYTVIEQIDDQFLDWAILDDDGNMFKASSNFGGGPGGGGDEADLKYYGTDQSAYTDLYELKSNEDENDWSDLIEFIDFINNSSDQVFENELTNHFDLDTYLRSAALDNLFSNLDTYTGSARNYYLYHNLTTEKWEWIKWDANESFGTYRGGPGLNNLITLPINYSSDDRPLLENIFNSAVLFNEYTISLCELTSQYFNTEYLHPRIDAIKSMIQASVYADNNKMYSDANFDTNVESDISEGGGPMGGTVYGLKSFVDQRAAYLTGAVDCSVSSNDSKFAAVDLSINPNPFSEIVNIELKNNAYFDRLTILNVFGQIQMQISIQNDEDMQVDLSALISGTYFVSLSTQENNQVVSPVFKIVKL